MLEKVMQKQLDTRNSPGQVALTETRREGFWGPFTASLVMIPLGALRSVEIPAFAASEEISGCHTKARYLRQFNSVEKDSDILYFFANG